jgi:hypothetical protein
MVVPDQDKDVYSRLNPNAAPTGPEKLLPPPAAPQIPPATPPASPSCYRRCSARPGCGKPAGPGGEPPAPDGWPGAAIRRQPCSRGPIRPPASPAIDRHPDRLISRYRIQLAPEDEEQAQATGACRNPMAMYWQSRAGQARTWGSDLYRVQRTH